MIENTRRTCVLLSSYNGEKYLAEQIDSLLHQEGIILNVIIRDDGSTDNTIGIIQKYVEKYPSLINLISSNGNVGVSRSFILLLKYAFSMKFDYYFFCDQDDFWKPDKCRRAIERIQHIQGDALYFSRKTIVDSKLDPTGAKDLIEFSGTFWDSFGYSNVSGCTMCFNNTLAEKLVLNDFIEKRYLHDAFLYRMAIAVNAMLVYDDYETIFYRQHSNNVVGAKAKRGIRELTKRNTIKTRKHYIQEMFRDILLLYPAFIPGKNHDIINMIEYYDKVPLIKLRLISTVQHSDCPKDIKKRMIAKTILNIL